MLAATSGLADAELEGAVGGLQGDPHARGWPRLRELALFCF
jgi:hypothetical protein